MESYNNDKAIMWCLYLYIPSLIHTWRNDMLKEGYESLRAVLRMAKNDYMLQSHNYKALHSLDMWIYECFVHHLTRYDRLRLKLCMVWQRIQRKYNLYGNFGCWITWRLLK